MTQSRRDWGLLQEGAGHAVAARWKHDHLKLALHLTNHELLV